MNILGINVEHGILETQGNVESSDISTDNPPRIQIKDVSYSAYFSFYKFNGGIDEEVVSELYDLAKEVRGALSKIDLNKNMLLEDGSQQFTDEELEEELDSVRAILSSKIDDYVSKNKLEKFEVE